MTLRVCMLAALVLTSIAPAPAVAQFKPVEDQPNAVWAPSPQQYLPDFLIDQKPNRSFWILPASQQPKAYAMAALAQNYANKADWQSLGKLGQQMVADYPTLDLGYSLQMIAAIKSGDQETTAQLLQSALEKGWSFDQAFTSKTMFSAIVPAGRDSAQITELKVNIDATQKLYDRLSQDNTQSKVEDQTATIADANTSYEPHTGLFYPRFSIDKAQFGASPLMDKSAISPKLNALYRTGRASGNIGDYYVNADRNHSILRKSQFPQLSFVTFDDPYKTQNFDYGIANRAIMPGPAIGNSSTARGGKTSIPSLMLESPRALNTALAQYQSNQLYVYPAVADFTPGLADNYLSNQTFVSTTIGRSGSDKPLLRAYAIALAALPRETKKLATEEGLIAPLQQMLIRRSLTDTDYLSPSAHPVALDTSRIDLEKLLGNAQQISPSNLPPIVRLQTQILTKPASELVGTGNSDQTIFTSPFGAAFIHRGKQDYFRLAISAENTKDPNGRPLTFHWIQLNGDQKRVELILDNQKAAKAILRVPWHNELKSGGDGITPTHRLDMAIIADNGETMSAPAIISINFDPRQIREYDDSGKLLSISYENEYRLDESTNPLFFPARLWEDNYTYFANGQPNGFERTYYKDGETQSFSNEGYLVRERDKLNRPVLVEQVTYTTKKIRKNRTEIVPEATGQLYVYNYENEQDFRGRLLAKP